MSHDDTYEKHVATFQQGKSEVKIIIRKVWDYDGCGMEDDLGKFTDRQEPGAFDRFAHRWEQRSDGSWIEPRSHGSEYRYFRPEQSPTNVAEALPYYRKQFPKHLAWLHANALPRYQYERAEALNNQNWGYIGIVAELYVNGEEEASSSCWGFESDGDERNWFGRDNWTQFQYEHNLYDPLYHPGKYKNKIAYAYAMGKRNYLMSEMEDIAYECLHEAQRMADADHGKNELALRRWFKKELKTKTLAQLADWIVANAEEERC
jgi:hypothetical protein